jgi:hypothetical protein
LRLSQPAPMGAGKRLPFEDGITTGCWSNLHMHTHDLLCQLHRVEVDGRPFIFLDI